ncbi:hypothetical protein GNI_062700 [Gregarina niphandrodes]|uniref:Uncharacterized protein n=1 Tax=Gregarina niphandrodes TaxID=110365 RepID=A0A023B8B0_GRENI|nr:hypothetical protein GNI_062700 [Gregarina niphandrodes]EZG68302.1 hypothetical protein GNI_062700 [Gregarina niphandrodes]|eukprot:XP_011134588.1 hypothetical protein GNI_062700 [Gregarina niphandrodes]
MSKKQDGVEKVKKEKKEKKDKSVRKEKSGDSKVAKGHEKLTVEERLKRLEQRVACFEGLDLIRRFRHHVMHDMVKHYGIDLPKRMNPRKRTNWKIIMDAVKSSPRTPEVWKTGLEGLTRMEDQLQFPLGFWDHAENEAISAADIEAYIMRLAPNLQPGVRAMAECSLQYVPPCARGNTNAQGKSQRHQMKDIEALAAKIVQRETNKHVAAQQDSAKQDSAQQDSAQQDSAQQDSAQQDSAQQDSAEEEE